jgi:hypothetical protein
MATRTVSTRNLVGLQSLSFIRPQVVTYKVAGTKPSTRLYAFFDGVSVDQWITPAGGSQGNPIVTGSAGEASGTFSIPAMTFNTGNRVLRFQDSSTFEDTDVIGSTTGSASATYSADGLQQTYQKTITTINQIEITILRAQPDRSRTGDPLAQTFFTYGMADGCFITDIDIFFRSKDSGIPVTLELREVENGYPSSILVSKYATVTLPPSSVATSTNASLPTKFTFSRPIYLEENRDYCFVLLTNSNRYNVWTSKLGEKSIETGRTIFEQPFIGTLFKSENNITWTAEQTEDIKFTMNRANFSLSGSTTYKSVAEPTIFYGSNFSVVSGSPVVTVKFPVQHAHKTGDTIVLTGNPGGNYRGISNTVMSAPAGFSMTVVDDYTVTFSVGVNATSTGKLSSSGILDFVFVDAPGSGYVAPNISFSGGGGSGAAATANVVGGKIISVTITNPGSGYTSTPTLTLTDASGTGAQLVPISEAMFSIALNRKFQEVIPVLIHGIPPSTVISGSTKTSNESYVVGTSIDTPLGKATNIGKLCALVSSKVETASFGSSNSTEFLLNLSSSNPNVSPVVDIGQKPTLKLRNYLVNSATNSASETAAANGTAQARYISQINTIATVSKDVRVLVEAASIQTTSFNVFIRTSLTGATTNHTDGTWTKLTCKTLTNTSPTIEDYRDYEFYTTTSLAPFDVYDIKIVLYSEAKYVYPSIANYRVIILAT